MIINAQIISEGPFAQFLFPDFTNAKVKMQNGEIHDLVMNFNIVSEKMVYKKNDKLYDLLNAEMTDTIYLQKVNSYHQVVYYMRLYWKLKFHFTSDTRENYYLQEPQQDME